MDSQQTSSQVDGAAGDAAAFAARFREANVELLIKRVRLLGSLGAMVYFAFFLLDITLAPQFWGWVLAIRIGGVAVLLGAAALSFTRLARRWLQPAAVAGYVVVSLSLVAMTPVLGGFASNYYVGVMLVMFAAGLLMPWPLVATLLSCAIIVVVYFLCNVVLFGLSQQALAPMLFLSGTAFFTVVATETSWRMRRADLVMRLQLEALNKELRALDETKSRFFANVSHELRTPLTLILGALREAERQIQGPMRPRVSAGLRNAAHLLSLVNDLLDLTKLEGTNRIVSKELVDAASLVRHVAANFQSSGVRKRLQVEGAETPVVIEADPKLLTKVIYNLLSNAFKFSDEARAPVQIALQRSDDSIAIMVRDQGIGIPQDKLESIFDRFSQVDARATRRYQGTGIGLALVREAVQAHDGDVRVESTLGQGSTFTISLPRGATADLTEPVASVSTPSDLALPGQQDQQITCNVLLSFPETERAPLILVAEDNTDLRNYLYSILAPSFRVIVCPDGAAAIEMHRRHAPEVVLTDLMMPGVGGEGVIKSLRAAAGSVQTPIIVLTADIEPETRASLLEQGAADFLAKPFDEKELFARIGVALRLRQQEQRLDALAHKDGLTDIANRRQFDRQLADAWHSALAAGQPLSLLICDIDFFKHFNDRYGHPAGDDCLKQVARVVEGALYRTVDLAARYGGEEFAVLLPVTEPDGATVVARRIVEGVRALGIPHDQSEVAKVVTVSVGGFTLWPEPDLPLERITKLADEQLYQAKRSGRNQVQMAVRGSGAAYPAVSPPGGVSSGALETE